MLYDFGYDNKRFVYVLIRYLKKYCCFVLITSNFFYIINGLNIEKEELFTLKTKKLNCLKCENNFIFMF